MIAVELTDHLSSAEMIVPRNLNVWTYFLAPRERDNSTEEQNYSTKATENVEAAWIPAFPQLIHGNGLNSAQSLAGDNISLQTRRATAGAEEQPGEDGETSAQDLWGDPADATLTGDLANRLHNGERGKRLCFDAEH